MNSYKIIDLLGDVISGEWGQEPTGVEDVKIIRTTNFSNDGRLDLTKEIVFRNIDRKKVSTKRLNYGDIIIEKSGGSPDQPVGRVVYFDVEDGTYLCNNFTSILRPDPKKVENKYLFYYLFYKHKTRAVLRYQNKTTGIINLKLDNYLKKVDIFLPTSDIQVKIVLALDKAQELIDKRKAQIEALDQLAQSVFLEMFGDPIKNENGFKIQKLYNLADKITDGTHHSPPTKKQGIPYVTAKHLSKGVVDFFSNPSYVSLEDHKNIYQRCNPEKGDILYIKDGATTGLAAINTYDFEFSMLSSLALIKVNKQVLNNYYLVYLLNNERIYNKITSGMTGGAIKRLTLSKINDIEIIVPPIELQNKFAEIVQQIESQKALLQQSLTKLENNFHSLMQRAFKGELFPSEPVLA